MQKIRSSNDKLSNARVNNSTIKKNFSHLRGNGKTKKKGEFYNCILVSNLFTHGPQNMKLSMDDVNMQFKNLMS